jgi:hypothetical protein
MKQHEVDRMNMTKTWNMTAVFTALLLSAGTQAQQGAEGPSESPLQNRVAQTVKEDKPGPKTWEDLGLPHLQGYPTDEIALFNLLNDSLGAWKFSGMINRGEKHQEIQGELRIKGGFKGDFKDMIEMGSFPAWTYEIDCAGETNPEPRGGVILAIPDPGRMTLMMNRVGFYGQRSEQFLGRWNLENRTLSWSKRDFHKRFAQQREAMLQKQNESGAELNENAAPSEEPAGGAETARDDKILKMVFGTDGFIILIEKTTTADDLPLKLEARTTERLKVDLDAYTYTPPKPDSTHLPNGYAIFVASRSEMLLENPEGDIILGPNIALLGSDGDLIVGKIEAYRGDAKRSDKTGYFVLNSAEGEPDIIKGLTKDQWIKELQKRGVDEIPELIPADQKRPRADWSQN